jgi:Protein of unknown function (DUF3108)
MNPSRIKIISLAWVAVAITTLSAAFSRTAAQAPEIKALPFASGEQLTYLAEFNRALLRGVNVAEFKFSAETAAAAPIEAPAGNSKVIHLSGDVASKGLFLKLVGFRFHQHIDSIVDANPFTVLRTKKLYEQNDRSWLSEAIFDHQSRKARWTIYEANQSQHGQTTSVDFLEPVQDMLTVIYFVRTLPLEVGKTFDVPLSDAGRVFRFSVAVRERKRIRTMLGKVNAVRIEPSLFGEDGVVRRRGTLSIWITDDPRRLPVKAQLKVDMGTFDITLKKVSYHQPQ